MERTERNYGAERNFGAERNYGATGNYAAEGMGRNELIFSFLLGLGTGAALMYLLDPDRGGRRRALIRDKAVGLTNEARQAINSTAADLSNRAYGVYAETAKAVTGKPLDKPASETDTGTDTAASSAAGAGGI